MTMRARGVRLADGHEVAADAVVVALADASARRPPARRCGGDHRGVAPPSVAVPVRMAHLDVALRPLPSTRFPNVFGVAEPIFVTVPSSVASIAPPGGAVLHIARYLRPARRAAITVPAWRPCSTWRSPTGVTTWWMPATCPARW